MVINLSPFSVTLEGKGFSLQPREPLIKLHHGTKFCHTSLHLKGNRKQRSVRSLVGWKNGPFFFAVFFYVYIYIIIYIIYVFLFVLLVGVGV